MSRLPTALATGSLALVLTAVPAAAASYQVEHGDTLSEIADRFGTSVSALTRLNGVTDPDRIVAGRSLQLPNAGASPAGSAPRAVGGGHVVRPGETLGAIAARYGTTVRALVDRNGLRSPNRIVAGTSLQVPSAGSGPVAPPAARGRHVVQPGDTLGGIAARHGVPQADLARWNGITGSRVYAGTSLVLYEPGPQPSVSIACPVPGATFFNDWGFPRANGRVHEGNDLFAPRGTPVRAPVAGVVRTTTGAIGGLQFTLTDGAGNVWLGSHLDRFGATGTVAAGAVIGYVGDSGNALGSRPHLHLEYHPGGGPAVNAYPALRDAC